MPIAPDDKDWTWVIQRPCPDCGFDAAEVAREDLAPRLESANAAWVRLLHGDDLATRPDEATWSTLEYGCHVRDVHRVYAGRLQRMLAEDDPRYENWDQDATALEDRYAEQDPGAVADELRAVGADVEALFAAVVGNQWQRPGRRSDGASFTVESIGRYYLHDIEHHLWDVTGSRAPS